MEGDRSHRTPRWAQDPQDGPVTPAPFEYMVTCPLDKNHRILNTHLMVHVAKCRRSRQLDKKDRNIDLSMQHCRYNHAHFFPSDDIHRHELECPDRFDMFKYTFALNNIAEPSNETDTDAGFEPPEFRQSSSMIRITSTQDLLHKIRVDGYGSQNLGCSSSSYAASSVGSGSQNITDNDNDDAESTTSTISASGDQASYVEGPKLKSEASGTASTDCFNDSTSQSAFSSDDTMSVGRVNREMRYGFRQPLRTYEPAESSCVDDDDDEMWDTSPKTTGFNLGRDVPYMFQPLPKMATKREKKADRQEVAARFQRFLQHREENNQDGRYITKFVTTPRVVGNDWVDPELAFDEKDIPRWWDPTGSKKGVNY